MFGVTNEAYFSANANVIGNINAANANISSNLYVAGLVKFASNVDMSSKWINSVSDPAQAQDVATKSYVDTLVSSGISYHTQVQAGTTTTLAAMTGGTISYLNGTSGVGATLTVVGGTFNTLDGVDMTLVIPSNGIDGNKSRVLVKDEANQTRNGIYYYTNSTTLTRSSDADEYGQDTATQISINDYFFIAGGTVNGGSAYVVSGPKGTITFGVSNITFASFTTSKLYTASTGLTLTGTAFSITSTAVTPATYGTAEKVSQIVVNQQGQITSASSVDITAPAGALTGTTLKSTVVTSSLTSVGTLTGLNVSGTITGQTKYVGNVEALANNITTTTGNVSVDSGNITTTSGKFVGNGAFITNVPNIKTGLNEVIASQVGNVQVNVNGTSGILIVKDAGTAGADQGNVVLVDTGNLAVKSGYYYKGDGSQLTGVKATQIANGKSTVFAYLDSNISVNPNGIANSVVFANISQTTNGNLIYSNGNIVVNKLDGTAGAGHIFANGSQLSGIVSNALSNGSSNVQVYSNGNIQIGLSSFANTITFANKAQSAGNIILANGNIVLANLDGNFFYGNGSTLNGLVKLAANASNLIIYGANGNIGVSVNNVANTVLFANSADGTGNVLITKGNIYVGNVSGTATEGYIFGNGAFLSGVATSTVPNTLSNGSINTSNVIVQANGNIYFSTAGTSNVVIVANYQLTGGNTITSNGNIVVNKFDGTSKIGYVFANGYFLTSIANMSHGTSNITIRKDSNILVSVAGISNVLDISGSTVIANANLVLTTGGGSNISNVNYITANYFVGDGSYLGNITKGNAVVNGNTSVAIPVINGNAYISVGGNANVVTFANLTTGSGNVVISNGNMLINNTTGVVAAGYIFGNGAYLTGIGSVGTGNINASNLVASGNIVGGNIIAGSNLIVTTGNANVGNVNLTYTLYGGNIDLRNNTFTTLSYANAGNVFAGNVYATSNVRANGAVLGSTTVSPEAGTELLIVAQTQTSVYPTTGSSLTTGTDLHISGVDGSQTRITQDAFGTGSYVAFTGRTARGTAASPSQTASGDALAQFTARGFSSGTLQFGASSTGRVDFIAAEAFTDTARGTNAAIYTTPIGSITPAATAIFETNGNLKITGNIIGNVNGANIGYRDVPQVILSGATTLPIDAAGKHYYYTSAGNTTITIPASGTTNFPIGTAVTLVNLGTGNIVVNRATTGVTLYLSGNGTTSNRAVANVGMATLLKVNTDTWFINGANVVYAV